MQKRFRLSRSEDFKRVRRIGKSYAHPLVVLVAQANETSTQIRVGLLQAKRRERQSIVTAKRLARSHAADAGITRFGLGPGVDRQTRACNSHFGRYPSRVNQPAPTCTNPSRG